MHLTVYSREVIGPNSLKEYHELTRSGALMIARYILQSNEVSFSNCDEHEVASSLSGHKRPKT